MGPQVTAAILIFILLQKEKGKGCLIIYPKLIRTRLFGNGQSSVLTQIGLLIKFIVRN